MKLFGYIFILYIFGSCMTMLLKSREKKFVGRILTDKFEPLANKINHINDFTNEIKNMNSELEGINDNLKLGKAEVLKTMNTIFNSFSEKHAGGDNKKM